MKTDEPLLNALILAAGASRRLGAVKQRVPIAGQPLLSRCVVRTREVAEQTCVVLGANAAALMPLIAHMGVKIHVNDEWALGLGHSIRVGVEALPNACAGVLLVLADQARVTAEDLRRLADTWRREPQSIVAACYGSATGAPAIFPRRLFSELAQLSGDVGARAVLARHAPEVSTVSVPNAAFDLDTPEDLAVLQDRVQGVDGL